MGVAGVAELEACKEGRRGGGWTQPRRGRGGGRHALAIAVRRGNRRVAVLAVDGKKQPPKRPFKHVQTFLHTLFKHLLHWPV